MASAQVLDTVSDDLDVSITIDDECVITALPAMTFTSTGFLSGPQTAVSNLQVQCTNLTPFTIGMDAGGTVGATIAVRLLYNSTTTESIAYSLYSDSSHTALWGIAGLELLSDTGDGSDDTYPIYGLIPAQTTPTPGTYTDTVAVTVTY